MRERKAVIEFSDGRAPQTMTAMDNPFEFDSFGFLKDCGASAIRFYLDGVEVGAVYFQPPEEEPEVVILVTGRIGRA